MAARPGPAPTIPHTLPPGSRCPPTPSEPARAWGFLPRHVVCIIAAIVVQSQAGHASVVSEGDLRLGVPTRAGLPLTRLTPPPSTWRPDPQRVRPEPARQWPRPSSRSAHRPRGVSSPLAEAAAEAEPKAPARRGVEQPLEGQDPWPLLGESGREAPPREPQRSLREMKAGATTVPAGKCGAVAIKGTFQMWPAVRVRMTRTGQLSSFGRVESLGNGIFRAVALSRTCFILRTRTSSGAALDSPYNQSALLRAKLTSTSNASNSIILHADVTFLPLYALHCVCFKAPVAQKFRVEVGLGYVNAWELRRNPNATDSRGRTCTWGFTNYTRVLNAVVRVSDHSPGKSYRTLAYRRALPVCTTAALADGAASRGFWYNLTWFPFSCRLTRVDPASVLKCFHRKRVLIMGDSQSRFFAGFLELFLYRFESRGAALRSLVGMRYYIGNNFAGSNLSAVVWPVSPLKKATGKAPALTYGFPECRRKYYGGIHQGFSFCRVSTNYSLGGRTFKSEFNFTFSSNFQSLLPVFEPWKQNGKFTDGVTVTSGGVPFDMVLHANQLHDAYQFPTAAEYRGSLTGGYLAALRKWVKQPGSLLMLGAPNAVEFRNYLILCAENPIRISAFEDAAATSLNRTGFPNFLRMQPITGPRLDLIYDALHYMWPVQLAVLDLWIGCNCPDPGKAT